MIPREFIGRRVRIIAWYDHAPLIAAHRRPTPPGDRPEGTITHVNEPTGHVSVLVEGLGRVFVLPWGDVEVLPAGAAGSRPDWATCPSCHGTGRRDGRSCFLCAGSGKLSTDVAGYAGDADTDEMEAVPRADG